jgi:hypothetical protein
LAGSFVCRRAELGKPRLLPYNRGQGQFGVAGFHALFILHHPDCCTEGHPMSVPRGYLDFELRIEDLGGDRYRATVVNMPLGEGAGQVSNEFRLPFAPDELSRMLAVVSGRANVSLAEQLRTAREFGERLFQAVFAGPIYTVYFSSRDRARTAQGLRIKLGLDNAGDLAVLPWELLRDPQIDYLALSRMTPLVRHPRRLATRPMPVFRPPLRILVMISSPSDLPPVDAEAEWQNVLAATEQLRARGLLELERIEEATLRALQRRLRSREFHVFHYIGHSMFDPGTGQGVLALEDPHGDGSSVPVRAEDLARELSEENTIRLVVLNSCQSAVAQEQDPFAGLASSLVARGLPAVVAMQWLIADDAARVFAEELYRAVAEGLPVDAAVSEARRAISHLSSGIAWATPVLFMRATDGMLFDIAGAGTASRRLPRALIAAAVVIVLAALGLLALLLLNGDGPPIPPVDPETDLVVDRIEVFPKRPNPGEKAAVIVQVTNVGERAVGPFQYSFLEDVLDPQPATIGVVERLAPGESATLFIPHIFSWWGAFVAEVRIDSASEVREPDEFNNIRRSPIVTGDGPLTLAFDALPHVPEVTESQPVDPVTFAPWGLRLEAIPGEDGDCAAAVPWIVVEGDARYLGTGLPDDPAACVSLDVQVIAVRADFGGVSVTYDGDAGSEYSLAAFDRTDSEVDRVTGQSASGEGTLEIAGGFPVRLAIRRAVFSAGDGPTRILTLALEQPSGLLR